MRMGGILAAIYSTGEIRGRINNECDVKWEVPKHRFQKWEKWPKKYDAASCKYYFEFPRGAQ